MYIRRAGGGRAGAVLGARAEGGPHGPLAEEGPEWGGRGWLFAVHVDPVHGASESRTHCLQSISIRTMREVALNANVFMKLQSQTNEYVEAQSECAPETQCLRFCIGISSKASYMAMF